MTKWLGRVVYRLLSSVLLLSQYGLDITITLAEYSDDWLGYLSSSHTILENSDTLEAKHFLRMRRFGPFAVGNTREMYHLVSILAGVLVKDRESAARP